MSSFPTYHQLDAMDCGPTCLRMVAKHYGRNLSAQELRKAAEIGKNGVNMLGIAQAAERVSFKTIGVKVNLEKLKKEAPLPCIVHWGQNHFVVFYKISKSHVFVADPAKGLLKYTFQEFESQWATTVIDGERTGVALLLEPTAAFYENDTFAEKNKDMRKFTPSNMWWSEAKILYYFNLLGIIQFLPCL
jgi:ATP-binding cassette, subfamily B, bacterial